MPTLDRTNVQGGAKGLYPALSTFRVKPGFFFGAGKITQAQNNSRSKITQGFFKISQDNFGKKLMVPEVFGLI